MTVVALGPLTTSPGPWPAITSWPGCWGGSTSRRRGWSWRQHHAGRRVQHVRRSALARAVFHSATTKTLVPLDVTNHVIMTYADLDELPAETTAWGPFSAHPSPLLPGTPPEFGLEGMLVHGAVALAALLHPELFHAEAMSGDVETRGELTTGATVFDRRSGERGRPNMEVLTEGDAAAAMDCVLRGLWPPRREAKRRT